MKGFKSINVKIRQELNLFANIRPINSYDGIYSIHKDVDFIIVRRIQKDLYSGTEHMVGEDAAESIKIITQKKPVKEYVDMPLNYVNST